MTLTTHNTFPSVAELTSTFADWLGELVASKDSFSIALSGGRTPIFIFDYLVANYRDKIEWQKIKFYWGDERCVSPEDEESNYRAAMEHLLQPLGIPAANIFRIRGEDDPEDEALRYAQVLRDTLPIVNGVPKLDLVLLGMGADGHTASIFPNRLDLLASARVCEAVTHPESGQARVTLTMQVINRAERVVFLVTGADKTEKVKLITGGKQNAKLFPATYVNPSSGQLYWLFDQAANPKP